MLNIYLERWQHWKPPESDHGREIRLMICLNHYRRRLELLKKRSNFQEDIAHVKRVHDRLHHDLHKQREKLRAAGEYDYVKEAEAEFKVLKELERAARQRADDAAAS